MRWQLSIQEGGDGLDSSEKPWENSFFCYYQLAYHPPRETLKRNPFVNGVSSEAEGANETVSTLDLLWHGSVERAPLTGSASAPIRHSVKDPILLPAGAASLYLRMEAAQHSPPATGNQSND